KAFDRYRITARVDYEFVKNNVIQVFAAYQRELNRNNIKNVDIDYITGVRYKLKF
ncbi:MAG: cell fate regulator YaaT (PSP1 superfamily), partial [Spirosomataceae bacterium]